MVQTKLVTAEEFFERPDDGRHSELIQGEVHEVAPTGGPHGAVQVKFGRYLDNWIDDQGLALIVASDVGIVLSRNPDTVRAPDVCMFARDRLPDGQLPEGFSSFVPDLVIEIVSPHDGAGDIEHKVGEWLAAGVRLVWVAYPRSRSIHTFHAGGASHVFRAGEEITGEPVMPGFRYPVDRFFL